MRPADHRHRREGFSLVEVLAGLVILSLIVTTSLGIMYERQRRLRLADQTIRVGQVLLNESEIVRKTPFADLDARNGKPFQSPLDLLSGMAGVVTVTSVELVKPTMKSVVLTVRWQDGMHRQSLQLLRADTGGGNLW